MHRKLITFLLFLLPCTGAMAFMNGHEKNVNQEGVLSVKSQESSAPKSLSPTDTFKAYYKAAADRDFTLAKKYLSKGSIDLMEIGAKSQGKTFEQAMKDSPAQGPMPQLSNEKIKDDTATVDLSADGQTVTMPFVKEDGMWKLALDKLREELKAKAAKKP